jgi:hypothetical protein
MAIQLTFKMLRKTLIYRSMVSDFGNQQICNNFAAETAFVRENGLFHGQQRRKWLTHPGKWTVFRTGEQIRQTHPGKRTVLRTEELGWGME